MNVVNLMRFLNDKIKITEYFKKSRIKMRKINYPLAELLSFSESEKTGKKRLNFGKILGNSKFVDCYVGFL